jgi:hypothetical protein
MSTSIYPRAIPLFPRHRNLLDDVDANHINVIQRELTSVSGILGVNPHIYNDVTVPQVTVAAIPNDQGGLDPDQTYNTGTRSFNPQVRAVDHGTVSRRLDNIERGRQNHCFRLSAFAISVPPSSAISFSKRPRGVRFPKPGALADPFEMYDGVGVTLRKSGFWTFHGSVAVNILGSTDAERDGTYEAAIDYDGQWIQGLDRFIHTETNKDIVLNPTLSGFFARGTRITLRFAHNSIRSHNIRLARLTGFMIRENDETVSPDGTGSDVFDNGAPSSPPYTGDPTGRPPAYEGGGGPGGGRPIHTTPDGNVIPPSFGMPQPGPKIPPWHDNPTYPDM